MLRRSDDPEAVRTSEPDTQARDAPHHGLVALATVGALLGFAGNSLLARTALEEGTMDGTTFTLVRLATGAGVLSALGLRRRAVRATEPSGSWASAVLLAGYALLFAWAYRALSAGAGALLLFGAVQISMLAHAARSGTPLGCRAVAGVVIAFAGLLLLALPGAEVDAPWAAGAMLLAGGAWGGYTLRARGVRDPLAGTASNFRRATLVAVVVLLVALPIEFPRASARGLVAACVSGSIASGLAYALWYFAVPRLGPVRAATVQLLVPILAAGGGIALLGERLTGRLALATIAILGGIALSLRSARVR